MKILNAIKQQARYVIVVLAVVIVSVIGTWWLISTQASPASKELASVKANIGKLMLLPKDEEPTLAIVQDKSLLKDKFLLANAQNGDQVLVYTTKGQAIIYRPSINKIVAVSSITVDLALAESVGTTIMILNGTTDLTITNKVETAIKDKYPDANITIGNANKRDFPTTIIIDNTDKKDNLVESLGGLIKGQRGVMPLSESAGSTDMVIIIGKDKL